MRLLRCVCISVLTAFLGGCNLGANPVTPHVTVEVIEITPSPPVRLSCDELVNNALQVVDTACDSVGRNQACYGNHLVNAELQTGTSATFRAAGDIADLFNVQSLSTAPLNADAQTWGIVVIKAQANLPDTLPGQNITLLLFGDTTLNGISPAMQAVTFSTGIGQSTCTDAPPNAMLLQSPTGQQVSITINGATITMGSTLYLTAVENGEMTIATLDGAGVVAALGGARVVQAGAQTRLPLGGENGLQVIGAPSEPEPVDIRSAARAPLSLLPEQITLPAPIALPGGITVTPAANPQQGLITQTPTACVIRADWSATYTVQRGDTLSSIARRYNLTLQALQDGNCITDANRITVGQVLQVPEPQSSIATPSTSAVTFTADLTLLEAGACTTLRWAVNGASTVYLADESVSARGSQEVCPTQTTTYTLLVVFPSGGQTPYTVTIMIDEGTSEASLCPNQVCDVGENNLTCPVDCPASTAVCGNQICEPNSDENAQTCSRDCG